MARGASVVVVVGIAAGAGLVACDGGRSPAGPADPGTRPGTVAWWAYDADGDGWTPLAGDCDDADAAVHPGAVDLAGDGIDSDCDGTDHPARRPAQVWAPTAPPGQQVGYGVAFGDLDRDGAPELFVAAPSLYADPSGAHTQGRVLGFDSVEALAAGAHTAIWSGTDLDEGFGAAIAAGGDTDGDGFGELVVTSVYGDGDRRSAFLIRDAGASLDEAVRFEGEDGWALYDVGFTDTDGDGLDEVLILTAGGVGGGEDELGTLESRLVRVAPGTAAVSLAAEDHLAFRIDERMSVFATGDFDGDGVADVLLGSPATDTVFGCAAPPWSGAVDGEAACAAWTGEQPNDQAGVALANGGDLDGDGIDDALVGATGVDAEVVGAGRAYVLTDPLAGGTLADGHARLTGEVAEDRAGAGLHGPGDVDGDGHDDLLVGAASGSGSAHNPGRVYLFTGPIPPGALDREAAHTVFAGTALYGAFGAALASGDLDGDGRVDLAFGAPLASLGDGAVYLLPGSEL